MRLRANDRPIANLVIIANFGMPRNDRPRPNLAAIADLYKFIHNRISANSRTFANLCVRMHDGAGMNCHIWIDISGCKWHRNNGSFLISATGEPRTKVLG